MVEFVSYDGEYPNLCSGVLVLKINGVTHCFIKYKGYDGLCTREARINRNKLYSDPEVIKVYGYKMISGGCAGVDDDLEEYIEFGDWNVNLSECKYENDIPFICSDSLKKEIVDCVNANVEQGCCGGCI
jgi:hypothetical protein